MENTFHPKDLVSVPCRRDLTTYGTVSELRPDGRAVVHFRIPRQPKERGVCDYCRFPGLLSMNGATGEIVCMRSGCGHEHGFEERDEVILFDQLVNITTKRREEKRAELRKRIAALLQEGVENQFLTSAAADRIL